MSVEWDEELIAGLESGLHNCGSDECQERQRAVRLARAEHTARLEGRKSGTVPVYGHGVVLAEDGDTLWFLSDSGSHWSVRRDVMTWDN